MGLFNEFAAGGPVAVERSKAGAPDLTAFAEAAGAELQIEGAGVGQSTPMPRL